MKPNRIVFAVLTPLLLLVVAPGAGAQEGREARAEVGETIVYEREVFHYPRAGRPDPFRSLLQDGDLGIRLEDLTLRGVVYHTEPGHSVAVLSQRGSDRRIQARVGERVGAMRLVAIHPDRVEVVIEELGVARRETLHLQRAPAGVTP